MTGDSRLRIDGVCATMTWIFYKGAQLFSVAYTVRSSLKALRVITGEGVEDDEAARSAKEALMFWSIQGLFMGFELYLEFLIRWFPGYYYIKSTFLLLICFPSLRFTQFTFDKGVVPALSKLYTMIEEHGGLYEILSMVVFQTPFVVFDKVFPFFDRSGETYLDRGGM